MVSGPHQKKKKKKIKKKKEWEQDSVFPNKLPDDASTAGR